MNKSSTPKVNKVKACKELLKNHTVVTKEQVPIPEENLLEVRNLRKFFPVQTDFFGRPTAYLKAVDDVSFGVPRGKTMGIVGESGCGKTTMGRTILRLHDVTGGKVYFNGQDVGELSNRQMRPYHARMQLIFQDPYSSLSPRLTVGEIIGEAVRYHQIVPKADYKDYIVDIMRKCGLQDHYFDRYPHEFSGGQRQRSTIARALIRNPKILILDEATSALDNISEYHVQKAISSSIRGRTTFIVAHRLSTIRNADRIVVMEQGVAVESGTYEELMAKKGKFYELKCLNEINAKQAEDALGGAM